MPAHELQGSLHLGAQQMAGKQDSARPGVIDGREISWDELGRMVAAFEGWQIKLEFRDLSEEV